MTSAVQAVVDRHSCRIGGARYAFTLKWVAVEATGERLLAPQPLRISVVATSEATASRVPLHLVTEVRPIEELPSLLTEALARRLAEDKEAVLVAC